MRRCLLLLLLLAPAWGLPAPGETAPEFALPDWHGQRVALSASRGKVTLLNFWACWCDTWKHELTELRELRREQPELDFSTVFVAVDSRERTLAEPELVSAGFASPILLDTRGEVSALYGVTTVPTLLVLDAEGVVRYSHQGYPGNRVLALELRGLTVDLSRPELSSQFLIPEEQTLLKLIARERQERGLAPLRLEGAMTEVGREYLQRMLVDHFFAHQGPEPPDVRLRARGLKFAKVGENLARAASAYEAVQGMLASPAHKANLLSRQFDRVGVAALRAGPSGFLYCVLLGRKP